MVESIGRYAIIQQNKLKSNFGAAVQTTPVQSDTIQVSQERPKKAKNKKNFWERNHAAISCLTSISLVGILLVSVLSLKGKKVKPQELLRKFEPNEFSPKDFNDVIGMDEAKGKLNRLIVNPLKSANIKKIYEEQYKIKPPSGFLFEGPPGNGKTFIVQALSRELKTDLYMLNMSDLGSKYIHETGENIAKAFDLVKAKAKISDKPVILFLDELDAISRNRTGDSKSHEVEELSAILQNINNLQHENIILIGATNRKELIDPAVLRSGRFAEHIFVDNPNTEAIENFIKKSLQNNPKGKDFLNETNTIKELSVKMKGLSNADIKHVIENASRIAVEDNQSNIGKIHFMKSINDFVKSRKLFEADNDAYNISSKKTMQRIEKWLKDYFSSIQNFMNKFDKDLQQAYGPVSSGLDDVSDVDKLLSKETPKATNDTIPNKEKVEEEIDKLIKEVSTPPVTPKVSKPRANSKKAAAPKNSAKTEKRPEAKENILESKLKQKLNKKIKKIKSSPNISKQKRKKLIDDAKQISEIKLNLETELKKDIDRIKNLKEIPEISRERLIDEALKRYSDQLKQLESLEKQPIPSKD